MICCPLSEFLKIIPHNHLPLKIYSYLFTAHLTELADIGRVEGELSTLGFDVKRPAQTFLCFIRLLLFVATLLCTTKIPTL